MNYMYVVYAIIHANHLKHQNKTAIYAETVITVEILKLGKVTILINVNLLNKKSLSLCIGSTVIKDLKISSGISFRRTGPGCSKHR